MTGYQGQPGGPSDPATPGPYCLARCLCTTCPQYPRQRAAAQRLREQEYQGRLADEGRRIAAAHERRRQKEAA